MVLVRVDVVDDDDVDDDDDVRVVLVVPVVVVGAVVIVVIGVVIRDIGAMGAFAILERFATLEVLQRSQQRSPLRSIKRILGGCHLAPCIRPPTVLLVAGAPIGILGGKGLSKGVGTLQGY